jgi:DNA-binding PadR family transcriptional regulator
MPAPLGEFETLILLAVLRLGDAAIPTAVRSEIAARTRRAVSRGAVYVTLDRLDAKRLLTSRLVDDGEPGSGRPHRFYRVAPKGMRALRRTLAAVEQMTSGLESRLNES